MICARRKKLKSEGKKMRYQNRGLKEEWKKSEDKNIIINMNIQIKLPTFVVTKFEGTHLDWFRFWFR